MKLSTHWTTEPSLTKRNLYSSLSLDAARLQPLPDPDDLSFFERYQLKRRMLATKPRDLRTTQGKKWLKEFRASGFTWPLP